MGAKAQTIEVRVLGDLEVVRAGRRIALPASKKTRALLGFLVVTGSAHLRERLCDLLWQGPDDPRGALRWSLTKLRALFDEGRISADRERVAFELRGVGCDLARVRGAIAGGVASAPLETLRDAAARFRGELLEGLDLPDAYRYHEWCIGEREAIRASRVEILTTLVERLAAEPEAALAYARQRLAIDPLAESAHVAVVKLLVELGRKREAAEQVEACKRILLRELGTKPTAALLAARVASAAPPAPPAQAAPIVPPRDADAVPLFGRDEEMRALDAAWSLAQQGRSARAIVVVGEPGIGKTRLLDELAARAELAGARVLRGRAFEAEMVRPYGAWIDALRSIAIADEARAFARDLAPILPELGEGDAAPLDRARLFDAVIALLRAIAERHGAALVALDDLQWFDEASVALLHFASRALSPSRVLVACSARGDELMENAPAVRLVRAMQRDGRLVELPIAPLAPDASASIARAIDPAIDTARVAAESGGNPLFALEIARAARRGVAASDSLEALLADRLERLEPRAQELLPWAAALGRGFGLALLEKVTELPPSDLLVALEELERRGVLRAEHGARGTGYDFAHDLVRGAAYRRLSAPRRGWVHGRIARALADAAREDPTLHGDVAHHAALAGDHELAARASLSAAERALRVFANDEAARLAEIGQMHAERLDRPARVALRIALLEVKAMSGRWLHRTEELVREVSRAVLEAEDAGMHAESANGFHVISILHRERGDLHGAHDATLRAVEAVRGTDVATRARQLCDTARCLALLERDMHVARELVAEARALLPAPDEDFQWTWANALVRCYEGADDGGRLLERALSLARRAEERWEECECLIRLAQLELDRGNPAAALAWTRELAPVAAKRAEGSEGAVAEALDALARVACCVSGADAQLELAIVRLRDVDAKGMLAYVLASAAELDRAAGRLARAEERAGAALAAAEIVQRRTLVALARSVLADVAHARGDAAAALAQLEALRADLGNALALSARVRARVEKVRERCSAA